MSSQLEIMNCNLARITHQLDNVNSSIQNNALKADDRTDQWLDLLNRVGEQQAKTQKVGTVVIIIGVSFVSVVVSVLVNLLMN